MSAEFPESTDFHTKVLALMYQKTSFRKAVTPFLKAEYFNGKIDQTLAEILIGYGRRFPDDEMTRMVIYMELASLLKKKIFPESEKSDFMIRFVEIMKPVAETGFTEDKVFEFIEKKEMEAALDSAFPLLEKGKLEEIETLVSKARSIRISATEYEVCDLTASADEFLDELKEEETGEKKIGIRTGIAGLDSILLWNGVAPEEMFVDCGPPGRGKSMAILHKSIYATLQNRNVLYYTLEVGMKQYKLRYYSCLTGVTIHDLRKNRKPAVVRDRITQLKIHYPGMGQFLLKSLPSRTLKPSGIERDIKEYRDKGINIDVVAVDYADIMSADRRFRPEDKRLEVGSIYEELRRIAKEYKIVVYTATQGNRSSLNKPVVDLDNIAEDFSKAFTADYVVCLSQTKKELVERDSSGRGSGYMRLYIAKNRNGAKGLEVPIMTDYDYARLSMIDLAETDKELYGL